MKNTFHRFQAHFYSLLRQFDSRLVWGGYSYSMKSRKLIFKMHDFPYIDYCHDRVNNPINLIFTWSPTYQWNRFCLKFLQWGIIIIYIRTNILIIITMITTFQLLYPLAFFRVSRYNKDETKGFSSKYTEAYSDRQTTEEGHSDRNVMITTTMRWSEYK